MDRHGLRLGAWRSPLIVTDEEIVGPWVAHQAGWRWTPERGKAIGLALDNRLVAGVIYEDWTEAGITCHIAAERLLKGFMRVIFYYPFVQLNCQRITAPVVSSNTKAIKFVERLGFELEATLSKTHKDGDMCIYRMWKHQCKWLR